jgi:Cu+-exporting ATPase
MERMATCE